MVERILIDETSYQAYGIHMQKPGGAKKTIYASKEVILSAGAVQSPQLLMLSGVGPRYHLEELGLPVLVDHPSVGDNLQDHIATGGLTFLFDTPEDNEYSNGEGFLLPKVFETETIDAFTKDHEGPIYWLPECEVMAFVNTKFANHSDDWPDIQIFFASYGDNTDGGLFGRRAAGLTDDYYTAVYETIIYKDSMTAMPLLLRPKSRGKILLRDDKITTPPVIYPNYYQHPDDIKIMVMKVLNIFHMQLLVCSR